MTIRLAEKARMPMATRCRAAKLVWLVFAAWSASRGPQALQKSLAGFVQHAAVLAIGLCFPIANSRRTPIGWKVQPVSIPALSAARPLRRNDR